jgi:hypothetical protein
MDLINNQGHYNLRENRYITLARLALHIHSNKCQNDTECCAYRVLRIQGVAHTECCAYRVLRIQGVAHTACQT